MVNLLRHLEAETAMAKQPLDHAGARYNEVGVGLIELRVMQRAGSHTDNRARDLLLDQALYLDQTGGRRHQHPDRGTVRHHDKNTPQQAGSRRSRMARASASLRAVS